MLALRMEAFDGCDLCAGHAGKRCYAGARRSAADMDRTGAAHTYAAAELRAGQADRVTDDPQQGRVIFGIDHHQTAIDVKRRHVRSPMDYSAASYWRRIAATFAARPGHGGRLVRVRRRYAAMRAISASLSAPPKAGITTSGVPSLALMPRRIT